MKIKISAILLSLFLCKNTTTVFAQTTESKRVKLTILENSKQYKKVFDRDFFGKTPNSITYKESMYKAVMPDLKDTLNYSFSEIWYEREFIDKINETGGVDISFNLYDSGDHSKKNNFIFYNTANLKLDSKTDFIVNWHNKFNRKSKTNEYEGTEVHVYLINDTIYTYNNSDPCGGTTPEGNSFRFSGKEIKSVTGRSRGVFSINQIFYNNEREAWLEDLYYLETPWNNCFIDSMTYKLPVFKDVTISKDTFHKIKEKAVGVQKYFLIEKRDSVIASYRTHGEGAVNSMKSVYESLEKRLNPNFDDARTPNELYLLIEFEYFVNELTIKYNDGTFKRVVHFADYIISVL
ncbi:MAG: hypothetical protein CVU10_02620 [Bacteroidetes bacterium HGW-Bacteroidetes-5]|jgi:hypothetical protein|nr:MAG: hypothetical protein CVU10_02620 [Bacteroidetes bacterium HGW-Bacteroidetes-5]